MDTLTRPAGPAEATEQSRQTMSAYLEALRNGGEYGRYLTDDVTFTVMDTGEVTSGRAALVGLIDYLHRVAFAATPDFAAPVFAGHRAMLEPVFVAPHVGEFAGIPATNRSVRLPYAVAYELDGDRIAALRIYLSMDALVRQLRDA